MEGDWEEQEHLVVAELSGIINSDFLSTVQGACKMVAVDSAHPVMQVGRYVFAGEYEDALGTCVILEESERASADGSPKLRYRCHTMKKLMLQRTFLTDRKDGEPGSGCIETLTMGHSTLQTSSKAEQILVQVKAADRG
uniref:Transcription factor TFIIIC triple barrel domain-containing protein n=1 Tax=Denticeps clupeoides TaxID=299321 RepID=A0AAY4A4I1_9TELE